GYPVGAVDLQAFDVRRDPALANALADRGPLGLELAVGVVAVERGAQRVGETDLDARLLRPQRLGDAGQRAARPDGADEGGDLAVRLAADLRPCALDVRLA